MTINLSLKFQHDCRNKHTVLNDLFIDYACMHAKSLKLRHEPVLLQLDNQLRRCVIPLKLTFNCYTAQRNTIFFQRSLFRS